MIRFTIHAHATVVARRVFAEVNLEFAVASHEARLTVTSVVVHELDAIKSSSRRARIRETFIYVAFATRSNESGWTLALKGTNAIDTSASVVTSTLKALVNIDLTEDTEGTVGTRAGKGVDEIVAYTAILTRARIAVVDVIFAIWTLEARRTGARVRANQILARSSVLAWCRVTLVDLVLTVAARITFSADASMAIAYVLALASVSTEFGYG